ncbi:hypothetical protein Tco_0168174 [Tanacetum coccineum]
MKGSTMASAHGADVKGSWEEGTIKEKVVIRNDHLDQPIIINGKLSIECKEKLVEVNQWQIRLDADGKYGCASICHGAPTESDMYPFSEIEEKLESLIEYQYKCFLRLHKEDSQVQMSENDKEKTGARRTEGTKCGIYLKEVVVKSKSEQSLIEDIKETLHKFQRVNMKIHPSEFTFGMEEGKFLGYVAATEWIKADLEKVKVILQSTTPTGPDQIRNLSLQLMNISRFIPKLAELMLPLRNIRRSNGIEEAFN